MQRPDVQPHVARKITRQVFHAEAEEPRGGAEAPAILGMRGPEELFLEMDISARNLDEPLEKKVVFIPPAEPEMFEDIVRLVVALLVETGEETPVAWVQPILSGELSRKRGYTLSLGHFACLHVSPGVI